MADDRNDNLHRVLPVINRNKCEGKADCVRVCPTHVFRIQELSPDDKSSLSLFGKLKAWGHGGKQAYVVNPADCHACGLCVEACPENAIQLSGQFGS